jgi:hypothetical protein
MPSPSYWPVFVALTLPFVGFGIVYNHLISIVAAVFTVLGLFGWAMEPSVADDSDYDPPADEPSKELAVQ